MLKARPINLAETNIAGLGTDLEKKLRLHAGDTESAWTGAGTAPGIKVWRIEKFEVKDWPKSDYGKFFSGDSYIVLNTFKKPDGDKLYHDIHFWLGLETSQDEAGTAAYKTVELDDHLGTVPIQHREIQSSESPLFLSYFKQYSVQSGGIDSGFNHTSPETYRPRLLHIRSVAIPAVKNGRKPSTTLTVREVPLSHKSLNSGDVFVFDGGLELIQWNGSKASGSEKVKAAEFVRKVDDDRKGLAKVVVVEESDDSTAFWNAIGGKGPIASPEEGDAQTHAKADKVLFRLAHRLSDNTGELKFTEEARGKVLKSQLDSKDVFVFDSGLEVFVWVGSESAPEERKRAMQYALEYVKQHNRPLDIPVTRVVEGAVSATFDASFDA
ncbi:hypothetical protein HK097_009471 [Rhizophlyctis rosea]|uniref:Gelsolin-like domain-containing protein n=1 Tax=Rhizophlyctis rosea TaxID=64517 RepID=A0AAD5X376_9FUNG|nr:hypothetical protein HK097_009471 [Rhizophlyctis rosea]